MHKSKHHLAEPDVQNRNQYQTFRLTESEAAELVDHARAAGLSVSELVRRRVLGHPAPVAAAPELNRLAWAEMSKTTANLNQLCHHLNEIRVRGIVEVLNLMMVKSLLELVVEKVQKLRNELIGAPA